MDALHGHSGQQVQAGENRQEMSKLSRNCEVSLLGSCWYAIGSNRLYRAQVPGRMDSSVPVLDDISPLFLSGKLWFHFDI